MSGRNKMKNLMRKINRIVSIKQHSRQDLLRVSWRHLLRSIDLRWLPIKKQFRF